MRIVCDTNVLVSGLLFGGHARAILQAVARGKVDAFTSSVLLDELRDVLSRPKFHMTSAQVETFIGLITETFTCVSPSRQVSAVAEDADDDRVLEAAAEARAHAVVSGDMHLLRLTEWEGIPMISPADFVARHLK